MTKRGAVNILGLILVLLVLAAFGVLPVWPYSHGWGPGPFSLVGLILFLVLLRVCGVL